jgi:hypothetical protein
MNIPRFATIAAGAAILHMAAPAAKAQSLDYGFYKTRVEPIFLTKRPTHARCVVCHAGANNPLHLEPLMPGNTTWTDEQSRRNFQFVSILVTPGDPGKSRLLLHPLKPEAGGDRFHSGGRQFASRDTPEWQTIAEWINGAKAAEAPKP